MRAVLRIRREPYYRRAAFEQGLKRVGFVLDDKLTRPDGPESWLLLWNRQGENEAFADNWDRLGGTVVIAENGYLQKVDKTYYAIAVHGHNNSGWHPVGDEDRFSKLGFPLKPLRQDGSKILVCGQRGIGSRTMKSPPGWGEKMVKELQAITNWPVKLRPHPGNHAPKIPLLTDLKDVTCVAVWSSAAGVMALVEGIDVIYRAPHWICQEAASRTYRHAGEQALTSNREHELHRMSHAQWHHEEIAQGIPFARIIEHRKEAVW